MHIIKRLLVSNITTKIIKYLVDPGSYYKPVIRVVALG